MNEINKDRIIEDFATNLVRLGNECRDWASECRMLSDKNKLLQSEVERLESDIKMEKENEDRLVRNWQTANNEVQGQKSQIAALIDNQTRLNETIAEMDKTINASQSEVRRLRKAGTAIGMCLPDTDEANKAYRDFENGGQP